MYFLQFWFLHQVFLLLTLFTKSSLSILNQCIKSSVNLFRLSIDLWTQWNVFFYLWLVLFHSDFLFLYSISLGCIESDIIICLFDNTVLSSFVNYFQRNWIYLRPMGLQTFNFFFKSSFFDLLEFFLFEAILVCHKLLNGTNIFIRDMFAVYYIYCLLCFFISLKLIKLFFLLDSFKV